jgi:protein-S-isoprenylcysteine O-methyltransferase Ste14
MGRALEDATERVWVALAVSVGGVVAVVLPSLLATSADPSSTAVAVLAVALAAVLGLESCWIVAVAARSDTAAPPAGDGPPPVLAGRATDCVHHPLRPRAPGLA